MNAFWEHDKENTYHSGNYSYVLLPYEQGNGGDGGSGVDNDDGDENGDDSSIYVAFVFALLIYFSHYFPLIRSYVFDTTDIYTYLSVVLLLIYNTFSNNFP